MGISFHRLVSKIRNRIKRGCAGRKEHILIIHHRMGDGGVTYSLVTFLELFDRSLYEIDLMLLYTDHSPRIDLVPKDVGLYWRGSKHVHRYYDFVVINMIDYFWYLGHIKRYGKSLLWLHGDPRLRDKTDIKRMVQGFDMVFAPSRDIVEYLEMLELSPEIIYRPHTINYLEIQAKSRLEISDPFDDHYFNIVTVARLSEEKGIDRAVMVMKTLLRRNSRTHWYIIGEGPDRERLEGMIRQSGLDDKIILTGFRQNPFPYLKMCDIAIYLSRHEAFCLSIGEALALGKAVICTDFAGARDQIVDGYNGFIIRNDDSTIVDELIDIIENKDKLQGVSENAKNSISQKKTSERLRIL